ncbi:MAG: ATP synthase F0 subunit B [Clostridia bacterium]|nr:ATP synthase F0 subunit B [Clostridia bacterium]
MPLNIDIQQILLHMLNFVILFAALYFLLYKPVRKFMDNRNKYYDELEEKTNSALSEAEKSKQEYEDKLASLKAEEKQIKADAANEAQIKADKIISDAQTKAADIIAKSKQRAAKEKDSMIKSANKEIRHIAEEAAQKLVIDGEDAYETFLNAFGNGEN